MTPRTPPPSGAGGHELERSRTLERSHGSGWTSNGARVGVAIADAPVKLG